MNDEVLDLTDDGCGCPHDSKKHVGETFTNKVTGEEVPAIVCEVPGCFCWRRSTR